MKLFIQATVPDASVQAFLQRIRDFDIEIEGCAFKIVGNTELAVADVVEMLRVNPELAVKVIKR